MAEDYDAVESVDASPVTTDNETYPADSSYDDPPTTSTSSPPLWERLGYDSEEALENTHTRYKQQVSGSQSEARRLQDELARQTQTISAYERAWQQAQSPSNGQPQPQQPQGPVSFAQAVDAYLNNDQATLTRYEHQQNAEAENRVLSTLSTVVRPAQYSDMVVQDYPDLNNATSPLYRQLYERYDQEAAHPRYRLLFPDQDPTALRDAYSPDGVERKRVDMRIVAMMAPKIAADLARNEGRKDEARRRGAAGGGGTPPARNGEGDSVNAWGLMSPEEQREIRQQLSSRMLPDNWPKTPEGVARKIVDGWKKRSPSKYQSRIEAFRSGQPVRIG